jgi:hypothetical protein
MARRHNSNGLGLERIMSYVRAPQSGYDRIPKHMLEAWEIETKYTAGTDVVARVGTGQ